MEKFFLDKGIIHYTDNRLEKLNREWRLPELAQQFIWNADLPVVTCSLKPMPFGTNVVVDMEPGILTMYHQILKALETHWTDYVFFCEHDVLYHPSHFEFKPERDDTFYYNVNVWRVHPFLNLAVTYDNMVSVSGMCVNRGLAIDHYKHRIKVCYDKGYDKEPKTRNPHWGRHMGFEPGKSKRVRELRSEKFTTWKSASPNIDLRHRLTTTIPKLYTEHFNVFPDGWISTTIDKVPGWNLAYLYQQETRCS